MGEILAKLKYEDEIGKLDCECPPNDAEEANMTAFRFCFNPFSKDCFHPVAVIDPDRELGDRKCSGFALSMYNDLEKCKELFLFLTKNNKRACKIGDHVAVGNLTKLHGLCTKPDKTGHFDLHEYDQINVKSVFDLHYDFLNNKFV